MSSAAEGCGPAPEPAPAAFDDPRLVAALEEYMAVLEAGGPTDRQAFLARHRDVAPALEACLDGVHLVRAGAARLLPGGPAGETGELPLESALGDFRLVREIGRGGMGVVYEAVQVSLSRRVALKVLPFAAALDARQLQRFRNEGQAAAHLHHTNVVPVFAVGCERGVHFYAMQLIEGQSLAALLQGLREMSGAGARAPGAATAAVASTLLSARGPEYFRAVARLGVQAAEALDYAHQVGVVHRDVKPANLLVEPGGRLWVADFGLARCGASPGLTRSGDVVGTLRYMSPDQALSRHGLIDHRCDVYSLGATLYEALTLRPPYPGEDREGLLQQLALRDPAPRRLNPAVPAELETVVLKAMAAAPEARYATAQELADDLRRFLEDRPVRARRPGLRERAAKWARRHRPVVATAAAVAALAAVALAVSTALVWQAKGETEAALKDARLNETRAREERRRAEENFDKALRGTTGVLLRLEDKRWDGLPLIQELRRDLVARGLQFYREFLHDDSPDPLIRFETGRTYRQMASVFCSQQQVEPAHEMLRRAATLFEALTAADPGEPSYPTELARTYTLQGLLHTSTGRGREAAESYGRAANSYRRAVGAEAGADLLNEFADFLADCPDATLRQPAEAVALARRALALAPNEGRIWNTLGVASYRAGDWPAAVTALRRSMELRGGGDAADWFFLAMCEQRRGDGAKARAEYARAAKWLEDHWPPGEGLLRARQEAARLLGLPEPRLPGAPAGQE